MIIPFEITEQHIAIGTHDACGCPAAVALANVLGPSVTVWVFAHRLEFDGRPCAIPDDLAAWVRAYDQGERVGPQSFVVDTDVMPWRGLS